MARGNGEGTIYFSEKLNKWVGQYVAGRKSNGTINRKSVYGKTRKEVKDKLTIKLSEVVARKYIDVVNEYENGKKDDFEGELKYEFLWKCFKCIKNSVSF